MTKWVTLFICFSMVFLWTCENWGKMEDMKLELMTYAEAAALQLVFRGYFFEYNYSQVCMVG